MGSGPEGVEKVAVTAEEIGMYPLEADGMLGIQEFTFTSTLGPED